MRPIKDINFIVQFKYNDNWIDIDSHRDKKLANAVIRRWRKTDKIGWYRIQKLETVTTTYAVNKPK